MVDKENVVRLTNRVREIRTFCITDFSVLVNSYHWDTNKDLRLTSIKRLARIMTGLNVSFQYLSYSDQNAVLTGIRLPLEENIEIEQYLIPNKVFLKIGFSSSLFFVVEGVLKSYLQFLDEKTYKELKGIRNICNCLLDEKLVWEVVRFDCQVFDFLRLIRNTLHSNGVHYSQSSKERNVTINYKEKSYSFIEGARINFVTWDLLLDITNDMRTLLFHLSNNKTIREIKTLIPDPYAI
jgi:hypothetical protein